jgi:hypothetical protein
MKKKDINKYLNRSDITIEGNIASWNIAATGDIHGTYVGAFKFKCFLTPTEQIAAGREHRELLGINPTLAAVKEDSLAYALTQLKYRVISAPAFWFSTSEISGMAGDLPDENIVMKVLDASFDSELKYRAQLIKQKEELLKRAQKKAEDILAKKDGDGIQNDDEDEENDE